MKCESCQFYDEANSQCRRYPPTPSARRWPNVAPDNWCGEYKKATAAAK